VVEQSRHDIFHQDKRLVTCIEWKPHGVLTNEDGTASITTTAAAAATASDAVAGAAAATGIKEAVFDCGGYLVDDN
jgi:ribosomal protein L18